jgi:hypothetical protein
MPEEFSPIAREKQIIKLIQTATTEPQYLMRLKIYHRLVRHFDLSTTNAELHGRLLEDFPAFCAYYLTDDEGNPLLLAPWQLEWFEQVQDKRKSMTFACRQTGKSTVHAAYILWDALRNNFRHWNCISPTKGQDQVYRRVRRHLEDNPILYNEYVAGEGVVNWDRIELKNGARFDNLTIGLASKGELIRGGSGSVVVDECQRLEREMFHVIVAPFLLSAYGDKRLMLLGTPNLKWNPELGKMVEEWDGKADRIVYRLGWERGVDEGCVKFEEIIEWMSRMTSDEIDMEFNAKFPTESGRYFPHGLLVSCASGAIGNYSLYTDATLPHAPERGFVMAVDWARLHDRTEIIIAEPIDGRLHVVYWKRLDPKDGILDWPLQVDIVKELFHRAGCWKLIPDFSAGQDKLLPYFTEGANPIMKPQIWHPPDNRDKTGYVASDASNDEMWKNHRAVMSMGKFIIPRGTGTGDEGDELTQKFYSEFITQHNQLESKMVGTHKQYIQLNEIKNAFKDLAFACAMLSLTIRRQMSKPSFKVRKF